MGYVMTMASMFFYARKSFWGPCLGTIDIIPWTYLALSHRAPSLVAFNLVIMCINGWAWFHWYKEHRHQRNLLTA